MDIEDMNLEQLEARLTKLEGRLFELEMSDHYSSDEVWKTEAAIKQVKDRIEEIKENK